MDIDAITAEIIDTAVRIHTRLGPGLMESVCEAILAAGLTRKGFLVERQKVIPFEFDGMVFEEGLRVDLLVNGIVVVEVKSVQKTEPVHYKQLLTYLRLMDLRVGLLINFGTATLKEGLKRVVNGYAPTSLRAPRRRGGSGENAVTRGAERGLTRSREAAE
jgi:GxxExxY protein